MNCINLDISEISNIMKAHTAYVMDIQRNHMCKITKANRKRFIDALIKNGLSKKDAEYIADNDE